VLQGSLGVAGFTQRGDRDCPPRRMKFARRSRVSVTAIVLERGRSRLALSLDNRFGFRVRVPARCGIGSGGSARGGGRAGVVVGLGGDALVFGLLCLGSRILRMWIGCD